MTSSPPSAAREQVGSVILRLAGASFGYAERPVLTAVDLTIRAGEVVAVLGPNGSGKSTLVRGVLGLAPCLGGSVEILGTPRDRFSERHLVGYVPQRHTLTAAVRATAREIVATGRIARRGLLRRPSRPDREAVDAALRVVGLGEHADTDVSTLSGGQQRRVLIARALAGDPQILLMDEPTAGVDVANQHVLAEVLARLAAQGVTQVIVTHELEALEPVVTRVVVIDRGGITFDGPTAQFEQVHPHVHHDHDTHHHDLELSAQASPGVVTSGPFHEPGGVRGG